MPVVCLYLYSEPMSPLRADISAARRAHLPARWMVSVMLTHAGVLRLDALWLGVRAVEMQMKSRDARSSWTQRLAQPGECA